MKKINVKEKGKTLNVGINILSASLEAELHKEDPTDRNGRTNAQMVVDSLLRKAKGSGIESVKAAHIICQLLKPNPKELTLTDAMRLLMMYPPEVVREFLNMTEKELMQAEANIARARTKELSGEVDTESDVTN